ncbi:Ribose 5-phosphate isomerase [Borrelia nietonii YOR]|uniref:Ribose 5-phosphate isomerase A n=1 Tax=Borrelia nietonii YOR TaxID=1293576 RepID=A0ABM5PIM2_9SPIR|nr:MULTISPECIES: ribose 5-phosphate isomerase A [Borrelia]AHH03652.1 Ribose 5-phosphate isomerase [Borrelia nietonii YOR]AHH14152.1 Ribose 5-phosphate isomerase [Borrelia hermsii MTW]UPA09345.1 ribose 5-phosphate isomerase A [Borrelia nietonii YOR]
MEEQKKLVSQYAIDHYVKSNMHLGIGTGTTVFYAIKYLSKKIKSGELKNLKLYPTSSDTKYLLAKENITYESKFTKLIKNIDITIDGADEILLEKKALIKGGGAAHLMEKIVAYNSHQLLIIADETKIVQTLGKGTSVPIEIVPDALSFITANLEKMNFNPVLRTCKFKAGPIITDNNNYILDVKMNIENPKETEKYFKLLPGILEIGIFNHQNTKIIYYQNGQIKET